jgi:hypothetical protein
MSKLRSLILLLSLIPVSPPLQAENHRAPILISGIQEPDEMRVVPFPNPCESKGADRRVIAARSSGASSVA